MVVRVRVVASSHVDGVEAWRRVEEETNRVLEELTSRGCEILAILPTSTASTQTTVALIVVYRCRGSE